MWLHNETRTFNNSFGYNVFIYCIFCRNRPIILIIYTAQRQNFIRVVTRLRSSKQHKIGLVDTTWTMRATPYIGVSFEVFLLVSISLTFLLFKGYTSMSIQRELEIHKTVLIYFIWSMPCTVLNILCSNQFCTQNYNSSFKERREKIVVKLSF